MKKLITIVLGCLITVSVSLANQASEADQKWLGAVEKKIAAGERQVSTPSEARVSLLKEWAVKSGYSVEVTKAEANYHVEVSKGLAQK
jgi:hypothetical protein